MTSILSGLDFYKLTMSQQAWKVAPDARVTFTLKNRNPKQNLLERVSVKALTKALAPFHAYGFTDPDIHYLKMLGIFETEYLRYLFVNPLPTPVIEERDGELHVEVTGEWPLVTFWETIVMSSINDIYFSGHWAGYETAGHNILSEKIRQIRMYHDLRITDFGTRRRFGLDWQETVIRRMSREVPERFVGTSNPHFAQKFDLKPIGTFAHEMPMVYAALSEDSNAGLNTTIKGSHDLMLDEWFDTYGYDYSIALTDTFGTDFFFATFGEERARTWKGLRHDSGDPFEFGEKAIAFYEQYGIDPKTKTLVFSDGLDLNKILALHAQFNGRVNLMFGWGTGLTNDVELKPLNIVMKATRANGVGTVKLSDDEGKHTGAPEDVAYYLEMKKGYVNA